jgi:hypothetical protein
MTINEQIPTNEIEQIAELLRGIARGQMLHPDILVAAATVKVDMTLEKLLQSDKVLGGILKDIQTNTDRIAGALEKKE